MVGENLNDRKLQGKEFYFTNLAADICLPKMVAGLLSHPKRHFYPPVLSHCSASAEATVSNPAEAPKFFFSGFFAIA